MNIRTRLTLALALPLAMAASIGCEKNKPAEANAPLASSPEVQRSTALPPHATEVAHGSNETLSYKADEDGAIYMTDEGMKRIVMRKSIRAGQSFDYSPSAGQAKIDGEVVFMLHPSKHEYKLYFEKLTR
jgi:hypothetical protein